MISSMMGTPGGGYPYEAVKTCQCLVGITAMIFIELPVKKFSNSWGSTSVKLENHIIVPGPWYILRK